MGAVVAALAVMWVIDKDVRGKEGKATPYGTLEGIRRFEISMLHSDFPQSTEGMELGELIKP